VRMA